MIMTVESVLPPEVLRLFLFLFDKGALVWLPAPAHGPPLVLGSAYYVSELGSALPRQTGGK